MKVQSSEQRRQNRVPSKQSVENKKKSVLPFSKQLLNLQKKIQQVEDKNELILQKIHKAYDFKKNKNKVYYEAPGFGEEEEDDQFQGEVEENMAANVQMSAPVNGGSYQQGQRVYTSLQPEYNEPREFEVSSAQKSSSIMPNTGQSRHYQTTDSNTLQTGIPLILNLQQTKTPQSSYYTHYIRPPIPPTFQQDSLPQQSPTSNIQSSQSQGQIDFRSNSNYSDVEKRRKIGQNVRRREKDFSDIKSNIEERRVRPERLLTKQSGKKSFIYNALENNSLYSQGNNVNSKEIIQGDDLERVETPITTQKMLSNIPGSRQQYKRPFISQRAQDHPGVHSTNELPQDEPFLTHHPISSMPPQMAYSVPSRNPQYQLQSPSSSNQLNFLQEMYKTEREKSIVLQKEIQKKEESIQHLKKYKKSFKRFFEDTHYVIEQAFDQFVETFLRNRVYKIQKLVKKNQNKLSALTLQLKDFKQQRIYTKNLKSLSTRIGKRSLSSNQKFQKNSQETSSQDDAGLEQNYSTESNHSRERSLSARKRHSKDKSLTKKSTTSQNLIKKEFDTIADNYQSMIKVKNEEIEKYEAQIKQAKTSILTLEEQNNRLKMSLQQYQNQQQVASSQQQQSSQLSNTDAQNNFRGRQNSGNLRILSRNPSRTEIKKVTNVQETENLLQKIKKYQQQVQKLQSDNTSLSQKLSSFDSLLSKKQQQIEQLKGKILSNEVQMIKSNQEKIDSLQQTIKKGNDENAELAQRNNRLTAEVELVREKLNEKEIKILEMDSQLYMKDSELKKIDNLLTLKTHKLQQFNKFLLQPTTNEPLNDSISSAFDDPHNKTAFLMLQNLQKQLQQEKYQKEIEFLNLKKSYEAKIQQLKAEFEEIAEENEKLAQRMNTDEVMKKEWEEEKGQFEEVNERLKEEVEQLRKEVAFLTDKVNFYESQKKTVSFAQIPPKSSQASLLKSQTNLDLIKPQPLEENDFEDLIIGESSFQSKKSRKCSGEISLLDDSQGTASFLNVQNGISQENKPFDEKKVVNANQNIQNKLSLLKDQNIDLSQKVAKLQKQNKFLKENETQLTTRYENQKEQFLSFTKKYQELQLHNHELLKIIEDLEKEKHEIISAAKEQQGMSPIDWNQFQKNAEASDLKRSAIYLPWSLAEKDEFILDKTTKDFDIRGSVISNIFPSRPSKQSHENSDKKVEELTKKLSQVELLLQNKVKINEQLIIGFTKKIDKINTQHENHAKQQAKMIEKYIQQNSKLRKEREKIDEEAGALRKQLSKLKQKMKSEDVDLLSGVQQLRIESNEGEEEVNFDMFEQRIDSEGFMLGINEVEDNEDVKTPQKQPVKFAPILQQNSIDLQDFEEKSQKIELLEKQTRELQETIEKLQKFLQETLNKVKQKQDEKTTLVEELQKKNAQVEELRDLIELKEAGKLQNLGISKQLYGTVERPSIEKSQRSRMNSMISLKYSQTHHGQRQRRLSFDDDLNFDFLEPSTSFNNQEGNLQHSRMSGIYSQNMSMIFQKEENFLDQIKKAKNKRKQQGRLLRKTFEYIKKLRTTLNDKNKKIKLLEMRLQELKDNCWLWRKGDDKQGGDTSRTGGGEGLRLKTLPKQQGSKGDSQQQNYLDHNQSLSDAAQTKLVDSRVFECNSQDLNKKKTYRHNHYKKMQFDTKLIAEENKILNKQIEMLQQEMIKIEEQENGLMAVKELYKQEIRALTKQNQQQASAFTQQIQKLQDILQSSQAVHNFEAIKQLFKRIIDCVGVILYPNTSHESKRKNIHQLKEEKRKQAEECVKVICSILGYEENVKSEICCRLLGQQLS